MNIELEEFSTVVISYLGAAQRHQFSTKKNFKEYIRKIVEIDAFAINN